MLIWASDLRPVGLNKISLRPSESRSSNYPLQFIKKKKKSFQSSDCELCSVWMSFASFEKNTSSVTPRDSMLQTP